MKKLIFIMMLVLTAGLFTSCQKGENFFNGTWTGQGTVTQHEDGDWWTFNYNATLTLDKKNSSYTWIMAVRYNDSDGETESYTNNYTGTYLLINDNTIGLDGGEYILNKQGSNLYWSDFNMTLTKSK